MKNTYKDGVEAIEAINKLKARQKDLGFSDLEYSMLLVLEKRFRGEPSLVKDVEDLSNRIKQHMFNGWFLQKTARKNIERNVRLFLRRYVRDRGIKLDELEELYQSIMDSVKNYGRKI
mgnify:CR=1 FL=1